MKSLIFVLSVSILSLAFVAGSLNIRLGLEATAQTNANAVLMQYRIVCLERQLAKEMIERGMQLPSDDKSRSRS